MKINCDDISEIYLLNSNPLYTFRFLISLLLSIIVFGICKVYKWSNNTYIIQIIIPVLTLLFSMVLLEFISKKMISQNEKRKIASLCNSWMNKGSKIEKFTIDSNEYNFNMDSNNNDDDGKNVKNKILEEKKNIYVENVQSPFSEIPHLSPYPLES